MAGTGPLRPLDGTVIGVVLAALVLLVFGAPGRAQTSDQAVPASTTSSQSRAAGHTEDDPLRPTALRPGRTTVVESPTTVLAGPTTTAAPTPTVPAPRPAVSDQLSNLRIDDTGSAPGGYARDLFPSWLDLDGNGCDAREDTLASESLVPAIRAGCDVTDGQWLSVYDGTGVTDPSELDVDHMVPLAEAWRSGAHGWDAERRAGFANDLEYPDHLIAVTSSSNRSKGDSPPDGWRPPREESWCRYATAWLHVKLAWELTGTTRERDALGQMLDRC